MALRTILLPGPISISSLTMADRVFTNIRHSIFHLQYLYANFNRTQQNLRGTYARIDAHQARMQTYQAKLQFPAAEKKELLGVEIEFRYATHVSHPPSLSAQLLLETYLSVTQRQTRMHSAMSAST